MISCTGACELTIHFTDLIFSLNMLGKAVIFSILVATVVAQGK